MKVYIPVLENRNRTYRVIETEDARMLCPWPGGGYDIEYHGMLYTPKAFYSCPEGAMLDWQRQYSEARKYEIPFDEIKWKENLHERV